MVVGNDLCENHCMAELDITAKLFAALVSTQGTLNLLLEDKVLPPEYEAKVRAALAANEPIIEEGSNHESKCLGEPSRKS